MLREFHYHHKRRNQTKPANCHHTFITIIVLFIIHITTLAV